jgi:hypothetical protein
MANPTQETYVYDYEPDESGYQTVTYTWTDTLGKENTYRLRFYRGLVSSIVLWPEGRGTGRPKRTLFQQTATYRYPGGKYDPVPDTTVQLDDVTGGRNVVLAVDDHPKPGRGGNPHVIGVIFVKMYRGEGPPAAGDEWVKPEVGGRYVKALQVATRPNDVPPTPLGDVVPDWSVTAEVTQQQTSTSLFAEATTSGLDEDDPDPEIEIRNTPKTCPFDCD